MFVTHTLMILSDLLEDFENKRTDPNAEICRNYVHQSEPCNHFETMDVQL